MLAIQYPIQYLAGVGCVTRHHIWLLLIFYYGKLGVLTVGKCCLFSQKSTHSDFDRSFTFRCPPSAKNSLNDSSSQVASRMRRWLADMVPSSHAASFCSKWMRNFSRMRFLISLPRPKFTGTCASLQAMLIDTICLTQIWVSPSRVLAFICRMKARIMVRGQVNTWRDRTRRVRDIETLVITSTKHRRRPGAG